jgi:hypothetical protein
MNDVILFLVYLQNPELVYYLSIFEYVNRYNRIIQTNMMVFKTYG